MTIETQPAKRDLYAPKTRAQYHQELHELAEAAFAKHEIREARDNGSRYALYQKRPDGTWTVNMCVEIIVIRGGLFIGGDAPDCMFRSFYDSDKPRDVIHWIGGHPAISSYVASKACWGENSNGVVIHDESVMLHELQSRIAEYSGDYGEEMPPAPRESIDDAMRSLHNGEHVESVMRDLYEADIEHGGDGDWIHSLGRVPDSRVFYAHAAVRRLWNLICTQTTVVAGS